LNQEPNETRTNLIE